MYFMHSVASVTQIAEKYEATSCPELNILLISAVVLYHVVRHLRGFIFNMPLLFLRRWGICTHCHVFVRGYRRGF